MNEWTPPIVTGYREQGSNAGSSGLPVDDIFDTLQIPLQAPLPDNAWVLVQRPAREAIDAGTTDWLELIRPDGVRLSIDFSSGKARHRTGESGKGIQPLARALGLPAHRRQFGQMPCITDATGGLGQDSWALASLGVMLTVIEQHPIVHALLANALARAGELPAISDIAQRITLLQGCAENLLPDVTAHAIYLDPMYPERSRKRAGSRKGMQFLHALLGPPDYQAGNALLPVALQCPVNRVVVKRPRGAEMLAGADTWKGQRTEIVSPNTRYDIYHCR